jgi:hypothetical protein
MLLEHSSLANIDMLDIIPIQNQLAAKYGLVIRPVSNIDRSFERALSICLFENEDEVDSISSTLSSQYDW